MNANLKRLICHFPIPHLVMLFMLAWVRPALGDAPVNSTLQYRGTVVDEQGRPVAGATVDCYRYQYSEAWFDNVQAELEQKQQTATDGKGAFAIPAWRGRTLVVVQKSGLAPAWKTWSAKLPDSSEPLVLTAPTTLSGMVVDTNGQPAADAEVWAANAIAGDRNTPVAGLKMLSGKAAKDCFSTRTSADGHFRIENFPKDAHATMAVRKPGLAQYPIGSSFGWMETASGQKDIELMLGPAGSVEGKVIDQATGRPMAGAKVLVYPRTGPDASSEPVLTGADGTFHVSDLRPDLYYGQVTFPGQPLPEWVWVPENVSAYVVAGKTASNIVLHAAKGALAQVTLVVTNTLQPIALAWVSAGQVTACTDSNGVAWVRASAGQNWISATRSDWSKQQRKIEIVDGQTNQFRIEMVPPPHISGTVRDPSGKPAAAVLVSFYPGQYPNAPFYEETNTDQNGRYEMTIRQDSVPVLWDGMIDSTNFVLARDLKRNLAAIETFGASPPISPGVERFHTT